MAEYSDIILRAWILDDLRARISTAIKLNPSSYGSRYKLTREDVWRRLAAQDVRCAVCEASLEVMQWIVDHDHDTGRVRGLLCRSCNAQLVRGELWIRAAYAYITQGDNHGL